MLCGAVWLEGYERLLFSEHFVVRDNRRVHLQSLVYVYLPKTCNF